MMLSILIPLYNEERYLIEIWNRLKSTSWPCEVEFIFANDSSTDSSPLILEGFRSDPRVRVVSTEKNCGKGAALSLAFSQSRGDLVAIQDADLEYDPKELAELTAYALKHPGTCVFGNRFHKQASSRFLPGQALVNRSLSLFSSLLGAPPLTDVASCYKVLPHSFFKDFQWKGKGFDIELEIAALVGERELPWIEFPISFHARTAEQGKKIRWRTGFKVLVASLFFNRRKILSRSGLSGQLFWAVVLSVMTWLLMNGIGGWATGQDPDQWYHLALARLGAQSGGIVRSLPTVDDLGWGAAFTNKEFLFHLWNVVLWKIGGEGGVKVGVLLTALATVLLLYFYQLRRLKPGVASLVVMSSTIFFAPFLMRLSLLRASNFAVLASVGFIGSLLQANSFMLFLWTVLYALSYHAIYVPLAIGVLYWFIASEEIKTRNQVLISIVSGIVMGSLFNPYFPLQIEASLQHLKLAMGSFDLVAIGAGRELIPFRSDQLLWKDLSILAVLTAAGFSLFRLKNRSRAQVPFLFIASLAFWLLRHQSPRALDYLCPLLVFLVASILPELDFSWRKASARGRLILVILAGVFCFGTAREYIGIHRHAPGAIEKARNEFNEIKGLLVYAKPDAKVFNCDWKDGAYILYLRPDLKFVDLLDPTFLYMSSKELYSLKNILRSRQGAVGAEGMKEVFKAQYALCPTWEGNSFPWPQVSDLSKERVIQSDNYVFVEL